MASLLFKPSWADATGMQTAAVKDGKGNYVLNGEKWFSSAATATDEGASGCVERLRSS